MVCLTGRVSLRSAVHDGTYTYTIQTRLYSKGRILGHRRGKRNSHPNVSLIKIEGVESSKDAQFYLGKVCTIAGRKGLWSGARLTL